jgi:hypothetical protein
MITYLQVNQYVGLCNRVAALRWVFDFFSSKVYITRSVLSFRKSRTTWRMMALLLVGFRLKLHANVLGIWPFRVYFVSNYRVWSWSCGSIILFYICHVVIFHTTDLFEVMSRDSSAKHLLCSLSQADNSVGRSAVRAKRACWSLWRTRQDSSYLRVVMSLQAPPSVVFRLLFFTFFVARSQLYRSRILQVNTHFAAFFKICTMNTLLHHPQLKIYRLLHNFANFKWPFRIVSKFCWNLMKLCYFWVKISRNFAGIPGNPSWFTEILIFFRKSGK